MKYWETIANRVAKAGYSYGYMQTVTCEGLLWVVDAYRGDGRRFVVRSDELLTAFLELEYRCCARRYV